MTSSIHSFGFCTYRLVPVTASKKNTLRQTRTPRYFQKLSWQTYNVAMEDEVQLDLEVWNYYDDAERQPELQLLLHLRCAAGVLGRQEPVGDVLGSACPEHWSQADCRLGGFAAGAVATVVCQMVFLTLRYCLRVTSGHKAVC